MLDMGFTRHIERILKVLPTKDKTYCFQQPFKRHQEIHGHFAPTRSCGSNSGKTRPWMLSKKVYPVAKEKKTELIIKLITEGNWKRFSPVPNKALIN
jgi:ATP-dependent RNA helicase RhlE